LISMPANMSGPTDYTNATYFQADGVHPNVTGAANIASAAYAFLTAQGL
jgi:lysophospholipase L1-like esterase